jgi:hypothetical protein
LSARAQPRLGDTRSPPPALRSPQALKFEATDDACVCPCPAPALVVVSPTSPHVGGGREPVPKSRGCRCRRGFPFRSFMAPPRAARSLLTVAYANPIVDGFARTTPRIRIISTSTSVEVMRRLRSRNTLWKSRCSDQPTRYTHSISSLSFFWAGIYLYLHWSWVLNSGRLGGVSVRRR